MVVDDHPVVLSGLRLLFESQPGVRPVAFVASGAEAIAACATLRPDILLLDLRLPDMAAPAVCAACMAGHPGLRVVILTAHPDPVLLRACVRAGASGCLLKDSRPDAIARALRRVMAGGIVLDPRVAGGILSDASPAGDGAAGLGQRELEVLQLIARGLDTRTVAAQLHLSPNTVKTHVRALMRKLGAQNRVQMLARASEGGLLAPPDDRGVMDRAAAADTGRELRIDPPA